MTGNNLRSSQPTASRADDSAAMTPTSAVVDAREQPPRLRRRLVWVGAVLLVAALVAAAAWATLGASHAQARESARAQALAAARHRVPLLLSYGYRTLAHDQSVQLAQTTGPFHDDYATLLARAVTPTATAKKISTSASVSGAAVVSGDAHRVVVLAFITQTTTSPGQPKQVTGSRVNVTLVSRGGTWKIARLDPV